MTPTPLTRTAGVAWRTRLGRPGPNRGIPSKQEPLLLSEAARTGSVPAMKELMRHHARERGSRTPRDTLDSFDELAARRER